MKEQRRVFQKINKINEKTELGTQKVEFDAIGDLNRKISDLKKEVDKLDKGDQRLLSAISKANKERLNLRDDNKVAKYELSQAEDVLSNFSKNANKLGIPKSYIETIPEVKELKRWISELNSVVETIESLTKDIIA